MSAVWVARHPNGALCAISSTEEGALSNALQFGWTVTRETLLTPEQAAVIAAAKVYCEASTRNGAFQLTDAERARPKLCAAVTTLRAQEGE